MRITKIETALLDANFEWLLVRVRTDSGLTGVSEAHWGFGVRDAIHRFAQYLEGRDPRHVERLWREMYELVSGAAWQGSTICAMNGIEIALWDLLGKYLGQPVWQLLGGTYRDDVRILLDLHAGESYKLGDKTKVGWRNPEAAYEPSAYAERARNAAARGFTALKFDIDIPTIRELDPFNHCVTPGQVDQIVEIVGAVRDAVGRDVDVAIDCHWHYNTADAIRIAKALEPFDLLWLEDPVRPENVAAMAEVTRNTATPICTGENLYLSHGFRELLGTNACRIIEPDFPRSGGISESRRIAHLAEMNYVPFAPHNVGGPLATIAASHVCANVPNFLVLEFHADDIPWYSDLITGDVPAFTGGALPVTSSPGFGVDINDDVAKEHQKYPDEPLWQ
ncbi:mandelate racemase/muconate lactonizing enzyme family protein [Phytoactinopolyspora halophila]|uniref:mandelate racemase/muconate lactonizing enzyme family protein n=1 Tax=Phytoactinopolyspora halophila TaxID=1981511 RepID=UPI00131497C7|nr:mandelate racemase/muconate lactonizing enzyme family protein [Phytoactinopolyspora halophila]